MYIAVSSALNFLNTCAPHMVPIWKSALFYAGIKIFFSSIVLCCLLHRLAEGI